jgi:hypothetical protein
MAKLIDSKVVHSALATASEESETSGSEDESFIQHIPSSVSSEQFSLISAVDDAEMNAENIRLGSGSPPKFSLVTRKLFLLMESRTVIEDNLPASSTQLAFLIEEQKWCQTYYAWTFINIRSIGPIDRILAACQAVADRHLILRTSFHLVGRKCYQVIKKSEVDFKVVGSCGNLEQRGRAKTSQIWRTVDQVQALH